MLAGRRDHCTRFGDGSSLLTSSGAYIQHSAGLVYRSEAEFAVEELLGDLVLEVQTSLFLLEAEGSELKLLE
jgi:hypothetical protein